MKINEVEAAVGVTKKNIRFYEEEGLITPGREPGNGYRSYSQADVERLRRIKLLRKLDVPLAEIREMLEGQKTLAEGMAQQLERLSTRRKDLDEAIGFCKLLQKDSGSLEELDLEQTLARYRSAPRRILETPGGAVDSLIDARQTTLFAMRRVTVTSGFALPAEGCMRILIVLEGEGSVRAGEEGLPLRRGDVLAMPATCPALELSATKRLVLLDSLPPRN